MTRADLSPGQQAAQCTHAAIDYQHAFPELADAWRTNSNTVVLLETADESSLFELRSYLKSNGMPLVEVYEPDLGYEFTALALVRSTASGQDPKLKSLSLMGKRPSSQYRLGTHAARVLARMEETPQTDTQTVLEHGWAVRTKLFELLDHLRYGTSLDDSWRLPEWVEEYRPELLAALPPDEVLHRYTVMHDCGKPFCLEYDEQGRKHFPDHAQVSYETYLRTWGDERVANLILHDMDMHVCKAKDIPELAKVPDVAALMLTSLAEVHANAAMFGGSESTSFKIKFKQIKKRGNALAKHLWRQS